MSSKKHGKKRSYKPRNVSLTEIRPVGSATTSLSAHHLQHVQEHVQETVRQNLDIFVGEPNNAEAIRRAQAVIALNLQEPLEIRPSTDEEILQHRGRTLIAEAMASHVRERLNDEGLVGRMRQIEILQQKIAQLKKDWVEEKNKSLTLLTAFQQVWEQDPDYLTMLLTKESDRIDRTNGNTISLSLDKVLDIVKDRMLPDPVMNTLEEDVEDEYEEEETYQ